MEGPAAMPCQLLAHFWMVVGGVVVHDDVDRLARLYLGLDGVEEAAQLLMAVALHVAADDSAVEDVWRRTA